MKVRKPAGVLPVDLGRARRVAVEAAEAAGALLRERMGGPLKVRLKGAAGDVVTELDTASEALILRRIAAAFPGHRIIAEESGVVGGADGGPAWLVDPLDGTNNVAIGMPVYAVGLALCARSAPVLGVVHDPVAGRTWTATRDGGAAGPGLDGPGPDGPGARPGRVRNPVLAWTQGHDVRTDPAAGALRTALEERAGRLLQLWAPLVSWVMLARGDIEGLVGYRAELIDLPAGALIAREAGVEIRRLDGGPYDLGIDRPPGDRSFVAARPRMLPHLLKITRDHLP